MYSDLLGGVAMEDCPAVVTEEDRAQWRRLEQQVEEIVAKGHVPAFGIPSRDDW